MRGTKTKAHKNTTWTPKVCKIMALRVILRGLGLLFYILLGFRYLAREIRGLGMWASEGLRAVLTSCTQLSNRQLDLVFRPSSFREASSFHAG